MDHIKDTVCTVYQAVRAEKKKKAQQFTFGGYFGSLVHVSPVNST